MSEHRVKTAGRWILLVVLFYGCGDGTEPGPSANVVATSGWWDCPGGSAGTWCYFLGVVTNDGPDCATAIEGRTHFHDLAGERVGTSDGYPWTRHVLYRPVGGRLGPGERFTYRSLRLIRASTRQAAATHEAVISWTDVDC